MSVRIHQLSKDIGMENKELIALLKSRGFEVKSASSTIDNISADALREEFAAQAPEPEVDEAVADVSAASAASKPSEEAQAPVAPKLPEGVFVKSAADIKREHEEKAAAAEAEKAAKAPKPVEPVAPVIPPAAAKPSTPPFASRPPMPAGPPKPPAGGPPKPPAGGPPKPPAGGPPKPPVASTPPAAAIPPKQVGTAPAAGSTPPAAAIPPKPVVPVVAPAPVKKADSTPPATQAPAAAVPPAPPAGPPKPPTPSAPPAPAGPPKPPAAVKAAEAETVPVSNAEGTKDEATDVPVTELKKIHVKPPIVVRDFAGEIGLKPFKLISELMEMGIFASMNQTIEESVAVQIASRHGCELEIHHRGEQNEQTGSAKPKVEKPDDDDPKFLKPRPPVVCILGHVDHGKTTLLDTIRKANVVGGEAGGITQHIGAYQIEHNGQKISFIDTPGHAAFSMMRERGANVTDVSILVVAADDAFKPQTDEALKFAKEANNAIIVAINKIDAKGANVDRVKQQMQEKGIAPEDWGGETIAVEVSALKGTNIDDLLDMILLQAEVLELKANPSCPASGTIVESQVEQGRGATATVIVERGTLKRGDALLCGEVYCRVKTMTDADGKVLKSAPPATPVKVTGWSDVPASGTKFSTEKNEKTAKRNAEENMQVRKLHDAARAQQQNASGGAATVEDLFAAIENQQKKCLRVIVKSDVHGSTEALVQALKEIESSKVDLDVISKGVGHITKNDITLASAGGAMVVGFNVKLDNGVQSLAKHHDIRIIQHAIIYELIDQVEEAMADLLDAEYTEKKTGAAEVRQVFSVGKSRNVAGCMVTEGSIQRNCIARLMRGGQLIHESKIDTLKRFKDDVKEVRAGYECGINVAGYDDYQEGDTIECFAVEEQRPSL
ncbi:translation initiation factor IF-2 [Coraliomargarita sp. SDUM461004]|uniref:Translation initiation factor IF-2 n=1 Tax=Thalassobacterium sedimentorum TaxID=3041258 RepID=A0ABU1AL96_9BACT|nr:translation initiation factor IF-2 [Coraliomargarita sp. SDUM461004]MDQ8194363.1 translation initiation factor IF-2 [Coraliomargarita sp. SDUM461004]